MARLGNNSEQEGAQTVMTRRGRQCARDVGAVQPIAPIVLPAV